MRCLVVVLSGTVLFQGQGTSSPHTGVFRARSDLVIAYARASDTNGRPVSGLASTEFQVEESGKTVAVEILTSEDEPMAVAIVAVTSTMFDEGGAAMLRAALALARSFGRDDLVSLGNLAFRQSPLTTDREALLPGLLVSVNRDMQVSLWDGLVRAADSLKSFDGALARALLEVVPQ